MKRTPNLISDHAVEWTGYGEGALLCSAVDSVHVDKAGNTIAEAYGRTWNVHPLVRECGTLERNETLFIEEGVYPIRFEVI